MNILVTVKSLGKKKNYMTKEKLSLVPTPKTLRELITAIVSNAVEKFNATTTEIPLVSYLTQSEITLQSANGKVGFGAKYNENKVNVDDGISVAITAFEDGLYKVFVSEEEVQNLDCPLEIKENDEVAFIKFTMLAGRTW